MSSVIKMRKQNRELLNKVHPFSNNPNFETTVDFIIYIHFVCILMKYLHQDHTRMSTKCSVFFECLDKMYQPLQSEKSYVFDVILFLNTFNYLVF